MNNIVVLGAPGVGKGTYTTIISQKYGIPHISTGDMFRDEIKRSTQLGILAKSFMDKGTLVPDDVTTDMLAGRLKRSDAGNGFMLDGFPRTITQAEKLDAIVTVEKVLNLSAQDQTIIDRLSGRRICKTCGSIYHVRNVPPKKEGICDNCGGTLYQRDDDKPVAIKQRLEVYKTQTTPLIAFYKARGILFTVDANPPIEEKEAVLAKIYAILDSKTAVSSKKKR